MTLAHDQKATAATDPLATEAERAFDILCRGGVAIIYTDVAYSIVSRTEEALRRVYAAKGRPMARASTLVGNLDAHDALHILPESARRMVRAVTVTHDLPMAVIAEYRAEHPFMRAFSPFLLGMATKDGTLNMLLNSGALRERLAGLSWRAGIPLVASSANASGQGTKYRVEDIEPAVRAVADIICDHGTSRYMPVPMPPVPTSSTQIDFRTMRVVRYGACFHAIATVLAEEFGVRLPPPPRSGA
ncbi:MAG: Sua5/YciO/YrdC/YwlC family protein [Alphaproteobacteria bacterium]|nr:Sua5/YciO/YrdC/YwlC family protein [Alphaproteobacteria bacterium]